MHRKLLIYRLGKSLAIFGAAVLVAYLISGLQLRPLSIYVVTMFTCSCVLAGFVCMSRARILELQRASVSSD